MAKKVEFALAMSTYQGSWTENGMNLNHTYYRRLKILNFSKLKVLMYMSQCTLSYIPLEFYYQKFVEK